MWKRALSLAVLDTLFLFGLIVFLYVAGVSYWQHEWLDKQVTHLQEGIGWLAWLRNDTLGIIAFLVSGASFFASSLLKRLWRQ